MVIYEPVFLSCRGEHGEERIAGINQILLYSSSGTSKTTFNPLLTKLFLVYKKGFFLQFHGKVDFLLT